MANMFSVQKSERSPLRRLPLLPRVGIVVDVAGRQFSFKHVPILETLLIARERGLTMKNLVKVASEALSEVAFPKPDAKGAAVTPLKKVDAERQGASAKSVKKPAAKAAAAKKKAERPDDTHAVIVEKAGASQKSST
jgi:hypothetical protein